ncbi:MAG: GNAT family N-acetyltransferase [Bacillati bacterium ANGP1]|uniref:GNAT family N-acetyltransferase n=1 Tax=Candidatus Segetimicrobium genomatis TaxID=2569760 RepID=A0A537LFJ6_9BACT|nr:MAG: GNAT family N-acetyltransferase [Terrabacteria group bacterium ANGP1]
MRWPSCCPLRCCRLGGWRTSDCRGTRTANSTDVCSRRHLRAMKLLPLDSPELIELVASWLGKPENYKWLDFGNGVQTLTPVTLRIMTQREIQVIRAYTADHGDVPVGVVGLTNVDRKFKTASLWAVLGSKRHGGSTTEACSKMLTLGFTELGLQAINAWTLETNVPAQRVLERLHFRYIGRQRQCHCIDGRRLDRLLFDLLAAEHRDV